MADKKISQLTGATTPLAGTEVLPIVQSGSTVKVSAADITAGRNVSMAGLTATGNVDLNGGSFVFNDSGADKDARFEGDTDTNLLFTDASADSVGVGTNTPGYKLDVSIAGSGLIGRYKNDTGRGYVRFDGKDDMTLQFYRNGASCGFIQTDSSGTDFLVGTTGAFPMYFYTNNIERGRWDTSGNLKVNNGNLVVGTSGKGIIDTNGNESMLFTATASAVNELTVANAATGSGPNISATGGDTNININLTPKGALGNVANRGTSLVTLDSTGIYAVASFGKTDIADNTATQICKLTGDTAMFGYVEILYALEDPGTDVYVGRHSFRMFWDGSALFNSISTENSGVVVPSFTVSGSGNDFIISVTANTIAATYNANFTIRWHSYAVPLNAIAIQEA